MIAGRSRTAWAVLWRQSAAAVDGARCHLLGTTEHPTRRLLFETRQAARDYIAHRYAYLGGRPDLRAAPHGWLMPRPVRVAVSVEVAA